MKLFIYMNEKIRQKNPTGPVIVVQHGNNPAHKVEGNLVVINGADARDVVVR